MAASIKMRLTAVLNTQLNKEEYIFLRPYRNFRRAPIMLISLKNVGSNYVFTIIISINNTFQKIWFY